MPALVNKLMLVIYKQVPYVGSPTGTGVKMSVQHVDRKGELPIKDAVDFTVYNTGTSKAYLFGSAVEILPGQTWSPPKSTPLPIVDQPLLKFEGDYEITRNIADLNSQSSQQSN